MVAVSVTRRVPDEVSSSAPVTTRTSDSSTNPART